MTEDKQNVPVLQQTIDDAEVSSTETQTMKDAPASENQGVKMSSNQTIQAAPQKSGGKGLSLFAILLSLVALAGSGLIGYKTQVLDVQGNIQEEADLAIGVTEIGAQVSRIGDTVARLKQDQESVVSEAELDNRLLVANNNTEKAIAEIADKQEAVENTVLELNAELQRGVDQFTIEETSQLLRLANNSVLFAGDIDSAVNALKLASEQLKGLKNPQFGAVRSKISSELSELEAVVKPDLEAISGQLNTLKEKVKDLPLANEPIEYELEQQGEQNTNAQETSFKGELKKIWGDMISSVSIQRVDQPPKPLLVPEQRYFLNENLGLAISKAELAMLQGQEAIYKRSLGQASDLLTEYFDLNNESVKSVQSQLNSMKGQAITVKLPDITGSYQAMQSILGGQ